MPTATKFEAEGVDNGFPSCLTKVNVSGYDYWTSLSGWSKVSTPADETASIAESRRLAMKIYWNVYAMEIEVETSVAGTINQSADLDEVTMLYAGIINGDTGSATENPWAEPRERVCSTRICAARNDSNPGGVSFTEAYAQMTSSVVALYRGSVDDPDLFVGYGLSNLLFARGVSSTTRARATVSIGSYGDESLDTSTIIYDHAYATLNASDASDVFNVFCKVTARAPGGGTRIANAADLLGYASSSTTSNDYEAFAQITGLDFYTYPA